MERNPALGFGSGGNIEAAGEAADNLPRTFQFTG